MLWSPARLTAPTWRNIPCIKHPFDIPCKTWTIHLAALRNLGECDTEVWCTHYWIGGTEKCQEILMVLIISKAHFFVDKSQVCPYMNYEYSFVGIPINHSTSIQEVSLWKSTSKCICPAPDRHSLSVGSSTFPRKAKPYKFYMERLIEKAFPKTPIGEPPRGSLFSWGRSFLDSK